MSNIYLPTDVISNEQNNNIPSDIYDWETEWNKIDSDQQHHQSDQLDPQSDKYDTTTEYTDVIADLIQNKDDQLLEYSKEINRIQRLNENLTHTQHVVQSEAIAQAISSADVEKDAIVAAALEDYGNSVEKYYESKMSTHEADLSELNENLAQTIALNKKIIKDRDLKNTELIKINKEFNELSVEHQLLLNKVKVLEKTVEMGNSIELKNSNLDALNRENLKLTNKLTEYEGIVAQKDKDILNTRKTMTNKDEEIHRLNTLLGKLQMDIEIENVKISEAHNGLQVQLKNHTAKFNRQIQKITKDFDEERNEYQLTIENLHENIEKLNEEITRLNESIKHLTEQNERQFKLIKFKEEKLQSLSTLNFELNADRAKLLSDLKMKEEIFQGKILAFERKVDEMSRDNAELSLNSHTQDDIVQDNINLTKEVLRLKARNTMNFPQMKSTVIDQTSPSSSGQKESLKKDEGVCQFIPSDNIDICMVSSIETLLESIESNDLIKNNIQIHKIAQGQYSINNYRVDAKVINENLIVRDEYKNIMPLKDFILRLI